MADEDFDMLLEKSSLGSRGARQLRARIPDDQAVLTQRIADLRQQMTHGDSRRASTAAAELVSYLTEVGYHDQATAVLYEWFPKAAWSERDDHRPVVAEAGNASQAIREEAEARLRVSRDRHLRVFGPYHLITLTTCVAHAHLLITLGRAVEAEGILSTTLPYLRELTGPSGRNYLQATFLLGNALAQQKLHKRALACFQQAYDGQRGLLGVTHVETLNSALQLAVAKKLTGDTAGARRLIRTVLQHAPQKRSDLYVRAALANQLLVLPTVVWRRLATHEAKPDRELLTVIDEIDHLDENVTEEQMHDRIGRLIEYAGIASAVT